MATVAIFGASGIGRHHAAWWAAAGAQVSAVLGRTPATAAEAAGRLSASLGSPVTGYDDAAALLDAARPDIVDVCTPDPLHGAHVRAALTAGCHVLCEKPFLSDPTRTRDDLMTEAHSLVDLAAARGLRLGVCTQYAVVAETLRTLAGNQPGRRFEGHIASPALGRPPDPAGTWCDLGPHLWSALTHVHPGLAPDWATLQATTLGHGAGVYFEGATPGGPIACTLSAERRLEAPLHQRRFVLDDWACAIEPAAGADGRFALRLETSTGTHETEDGMRVLIRRFLAGDVITSGDALLSGLDAVLRVRDALAPL